MKIGEHYVLLTDVVGSRNIENRQKFQGVFESALEWVNKEFAADLELPMQGWKGLDETAALIKNPVCLYQLIDGMSNMLAPEQMRMVLVKGRVEVPTESKEIIKADGQAFHEAAALMQELKKEGLLLACNTGNAAADRLLKLNINALLLLKWDWTPRQRSIYAAYNKSLNQEAVAKELNITQQTVSKTLKSIKAAQVQLLEKELQEWLRTEYN